MIGKLFAISVMSWSMLTTGVVVASGDAEQGRVKAASCAACHGEGGNSVVPTFPKLAGQGEAYLYKQLKDYASGARSNSVMAGMVVPLSEQDMADIAAYYANETPAEYALSEQVNGVGERLYRGGDKTRGIPACMACHGPAGGGISAAAWPALAGQHQAYSETTLAEFASGQRANDGNAMMRDISAKLTAEEITAVSAYIGNSL